MIARHLIKEGVKVQCCVESYGKGGIAFIKGKCYEVYIVDDNGGSYGGDLYYAVKVQTRLGFIWVNEKCFTLPSRYLQRIDND